MPSAILIHPAVWPIVMDRKLGAPSPFSGKGAESPCNTVDCAEAYLHTKWHLNPSSHLATTDMGRKLVLCPFGDGELAPYLTQCGHDRGYPHAKFHLEPSNRLATVHLCYRQNRQDRQADNGLVA